MRTKSLIAALALVFALTFVSVPTTQVDALPTNEIIITYYADASLTVEVGYRIIACYGTYSSGTQTSYYTVETNPCW